MKPPLQHLRPVAVVPVVLLALSAAGCQTLREVAALRKVQFQIDRVVDPQLAGVSLQRVRSYQDLTARDLLTLSRAAASGSMPFAFTVLVDAENPADNPVPARMTQMDWSLLLADTETISGTLDSTTSLPPGTPTMVPVPVEVDLVRFFGDNLRDLVDLALAVAGRGDPQTVTLRATPRIDTALGPIRYPSPITIVRRDVGSAEPPRP